MKFFRESILILLLYFIGEFISKAFNVPVPGNIIGMVLLFSLLATGILKLEKVETIANFFLNHLAFFFIPAGIGLMNSFGDISSYSIQILFICIVTTVIVMVSTGLVVQAIANKQRNK